MGKFPRSINIDSNPYRDKHGRGQRHEFMDENGEGTHNPEEGVERNSSNPNFRQMEDVQGHGSSGQPHWSLGWRNNWREWQPFLKTRPTPVYVKVDGGETTDVKSAKKDENGRPIPKRDKKTGERVSTGGWANRAKIETAKVRGRTGRGQPYKTEISHSIEKADTPPNKMIVEDPANMGMDKGPAEMTHVMDVPNYGTVLHSAAIRGPEVGFESRRLGSCRWY